MTDSTQNQNAGWRGKFAGFALVLSIFSVLWFVIAALGTKFGLWPWQTGLVTMSMMIGPLLVLVASVLSLIAVIVALLKAPRKRAAMLAFAALLISGLVLGRIAGIAAQSSGLPPIHDVQTDWDMPIKPTEGLLAKRNAEGAENPIEDAPTIPADKRTASWPGYGNKLVSQAQEDAEYDPGKHKSSKEAVYPTIAPLVSPLNYEDTFAAVQDVVKARGWEVVTADAETGRIEAVESSSFFGFKDDVLIRVSMIDGYGRVDVRSVSRVGLSDLGMNAKRVSALLEDIDVKLKAPAGTPPAG